MGSGHLDSMLNRVVVQVGSKRHLKGIMAGWERRVGIEAVDEGLRYCLHFSSEEVACREWLEPIHVLVSGQRQDLERMFGGDELVYLGARQSVSIKGPLRDQLKLDALLRLTCQ
ncbi:SCP-2 sterol transfer family protein [Brevibacillus ruminantium]|uniref:SCP-2 sterol transfer family protein n=1 Tax=Brevibacillus ruminantium TaxID=2950604 RepID=A0ABY4WIY6_9BACL|nr:SCP-2 sterol transfer family protein [Brevibacillus ruminantium]USG66751.1 SCP-2 sterol transfer family protein [Brevibacillus ruminantium]